jgi:hypothetical protein
MLLIGCIMVGSLLMFVGILALEAIPADMSMKEFILTKLGMGRKDIGDEKDDSNEQSHRD